MSTYTTYTYNSGMSLTEVLEWFPDNDNHEISALDVRNVIDVLWGKIDYNTTYSFNNPNNTTVTIGGISRGSILNGLGISELFELMFYPSVRPEISVNNLPLPVQENSTSNISLNIKYLMGSHISDPSYSTIKLEFKHGNVITNIPHENNITNGIVSVNIDSSILGDSIIEFYVEDSNGYNYTLNIPISIYPRYYSGAMGFSGLTNMTTRPVVDLTLFAEQVNIIASAITNLNQLTYRLIDNPSNYSGKVPLSNEHLVIALPKGINNDITFNLNGMNSNTMVKVKEMSIGDLEYNIYVSHIPYNDEIYFEIK